MTEEAKHTPGPWEYIPSNENHGPYVSNGWGAGDICDCYTMSKPSELAVCNGGTSKPIHFQHEEADANARLIAAAPELLEALEQCQKALSMMITPAQIEQTSTLQAFAIATEAEAKARGAISKAEGRQ